VSDARARVERVVAAGRRLADRTDPLGREVRAALAASLPLSPQGIALALAEHLETEPTPAHLDALLAAAGRAPRCHVVLAANVCTAPLRAVALAVATAPVVFVRASRRDPALTAALLGALAADAAFAEAGGSITAVGEVAPAAGDELHVYGADATVEALSAAAPAGVRVRGHGTGMGIAVVSARAAVEAAAAALARDVVPFDQQGCLSPRVVLVDGDAERADAVAAALDHHLAVLGARIPRGPLDPETAAEVTQYASLIEAVGTLRRGPGHLVGLDPAPRALLLPPAARAVHVVPAEAATAPALLGRWAPYVTCVGAAGDGALLRAVQALAPRARPAALGRMQRPPLDGPVDLRHRGGATPA
jgi:hypothetical protein